MSNKELLLIKQRIGDIQCGLLRFEDKNKQVTLQVRLTANEDTSLNCVVTDEFSGRRLVNKIVHLIQKYHNDFLHIAGKVSEETERNTRILAVQIERACWFVRRSRGNVSWLWQKCLYETDKINNKGKAADMRA
jgi:hypothetical protein